MAIESLEDLFYQVLQGLYDEEQRLVEALPKMARGAASARLAPSLSGAPGADTFSCDPA